MPGLIHPITGQPIQPGTEEEIAAREERQQWRTENYAALKDFEDKIAALRVAVRTKQGDHFALAAQAKAAIDEMVGKAKGKAKGKKK